MPRKIQEKPSKTVQCIKMLKILKSKQYLKKEEIAALLGESTTRNINNYKNALYDAGYYIDYKPGKYGGYHLVNDMMLPLANIKQEQIQALYDVFTYVNQDKNFVNKQIFTDFLSNVLATHDNPNKEVNDALFGHFPLSMSTQEIQNRYYLIQTAIDSKRQLKIVYKGNKNDVERIINPYRLYKFQNWHVYAWDTNFYRGKHIGYSSFKLHRIISIELLDSTFVPDSDYDEKEHFTKRGLSSDQVIHVKLRLFGSIARRIDEKVYGENQTVELVQKDRTEYIFEADMYDRLVVEKFVLSLGTACKVLEPEWLKKQVIYNSKRILEYYKRDL